MAFVNELISKPEDIELYNSLHLKNPMGDWPLEATKWTQWTIDRERNIILIGLGGQGFSDSEIPAFAVLVIDGEQVNITYRHGGTGDNIDGLTRWYDIKWVDIPEKIKGIYTVDKIDQFIVEAYTQKAYGRHNDAKVLGVEVTFGKRSRGE